MRTVPSALATRLATGSTATCFIVKILRKDGTVLRLAEANANVVVSGDGTYTAYPGLLGGSIPYGLDGFASGVDLQFGVTDSTPVTRANVRAGMYDAAEVDIWEIDQRAPADGQVHIFWGRVGNITRRLEGGIKLEAKGILAQSYQIIVDRYIPTCLWFFASTDRCGLDPALYTYTATITSISADGYALGISGAASGQAADFFIDGVWTITSGARAGLNIGVRGSDSTTIKSFLAVPSGLAVGDTISVLRGCRKRAVDCKAYGNYSRFGGFDKAGSSEESQAITYNDWPS